MDNQQGARPGRKTSDKVFIPQQIREDLYKSSNQCRVIFLDFSNAFDRVNEPLLYEVMRILRIPDPLIAATAALYGNRTAQLYRGWPVLDMLSTIIK